MWCASFTSWWGGGVITSYVSFMGHSVGLLSLPFGGLCQCHPGTTLPNSSLDSCLARTSNIVQASLVVPPLKILHLRHSQMAAARSWVVCTMVPMQEMPLRGVGLSPAGTVIFLQSSCFVMVVGSFQLKMLSVRQGTQHFTDENKVSRK